MCQAEGNLGVALRSHCQVVEHRYLVREVRPYLGRTGAVASSGHSSRLVKGRVHGHPVWAGASVRGQLIPRIDKYLKFMEIEPQRVRGRNSQPSVSWHLLLTPRRSAGRGWKPEEHWIS